VNIYVDYAQGGSFFEWSRTLDGAPALTKSFSVGRIRLFQHLW
jgi:hypothetical protein